MTDFTQQLNSLEDAVNERLSQAIALRDSTEVSFIKNKYRRIARKLTWALDSVHKAQELMGVEK